MAEKHGHKPVYTNIYSVGEKSSQILAEKSSHLRFARLPFPVLEDTTLTASARVVYAYLAGHVFEGRSAKLGQRLIGRKLGFDRGTVQAGLDELAKRGYISVVRIGDKTRRGYLLHSAIFAQKQGKVDIVKQGPSGQNRLVSVEAAG